VLERLDERSWLDWEHVRGVMRRTRATGASEARRGDLGAKRERWIRCWSSTSVRPGRVDIKGRFEMVMRWRYMQMIEGRRSAHALEARTRGDETARVGTELDALGAGGLRRDLRVVKERKRGRKPF
jgi:hypothetical protein